MKFTSLFILLGLAAVLTGCNDDDSVSRDAALIETCGNQPVYIWHDKLYYRDSGYQFRQVIATKEDVCTKFIDTQSAK